MVFVMRYYFWSLCIFLFGVVLMSSSPALGAYGPPQRGTADRHASLRFSELEQADLRPYTGQTYADPEVPERRILRTTYGHEPSASEATMPIPPNLDLPSPQAATHFLALTGTGSIAPPDTDGAVGPNHIMTALNSHVRIQNRTGGTLRTVTLDQFWEPLGLFSSPIGSFDPRTVYDPYGERWITVAAANASDHTKSGLMVAVSQTDDPSGDWNMYFFDADTNNLAWIDFPMLGFNKTWITVANNLFSVADDTFVRMEIYVFDKLDLYTNGPAHHTVLTIPDRRDIHPVRTFDADEEAQYFVEDWDFDPGELRVYSMTGAVDAPVFAAESTISSGHAWSHVPPNRNFGPQRGGGTKIDTGTARMGSAVFRNGSIWATQTVFLPAGGRPTRNAIQWWEVSPSGALHQLGRIEDPIGAKFYAYGSIAVNTHNDVLVGYSRFAANQYASANYAFRYANDPPGTMRRDTVLKAGEGNYDRVIDGGTRNRWGDYSATVVDPANDTDLWTIQEYAGRSNRWSTWWGKVEPGADIAVTGSDAPDPVVQHNVLTYVLTVTNSGPDIASDVVLRSALPGPTVFHDAVASQGHCSASNGVVRCDLGGIDRANAAVVTVSVVAASAGLHTNQITVSAVETDPDPLNNERTETTLVLPDRDRDGWADGSDNCPNDFNPGQDNVDGDDQGDVCDLDDDNDGMFDAYELKHGLNPSNAADAALNPDGDEYNNLQEFVADSDPHDSNAVLRISIVATNRTEVQFVSSTARVYSLEFNTEPMTGDWTLVDGQVDQPGRGVGDRLHHTNTDAGAVYRVQVNLP